MLRCDDEKIKLFPVSYVRVADKIMKIYEQNVQSGAKSLIFISFSSQIAHRLKLMFLLVCYQKASFDNQS